MLVASGEARMSPDEQRVWRLRGGTIATHPRLVLRSLRRRSESDGRPLMVDARLTATRSDGSSRLGRSRQRISEAWPRGG